MFWYGKLYVSLFSASQKQQFLGEPLHNLIKHAQK